MSALRTQVFAWLTAFAVLSSVTLGGAISSHTMTEGGSMHDCPYMGVVALCDMTPLEHLSQWRSMFAGIAQRLFIFALLFTAFVVSRRATTLLVPAQSPLRSAFRYRCRERAADPLRLALARGTIHSKAF